MLYLVFVLTFLCGILFYALSPRDDQLKWDMHRAEGFIMPLLLQHQAAKDYIFTWLGVDYKNQANGITNFSLSAENERFMSFFPVMVPTDLSKKQGNPPQIEADAGDQGVLQTSVFCLSDAGLMTDCDGDAGVQVKNVYLATYGQVYVDGNKVYARPTWWPDLESNRQRRYESWRRAITHRSNGSYSCGTLRCVGTWSGSTCNASGDKQWCIDNGQTVFLPNGSCAQAVPTAIVDTLGCDGNNSFQCDDIFFCLSKVKNGPKEYYVSDGLKAFYDGINNKNTGADGERWDVQEVFPDLINGVQAYRLDPVQGEMAVQHSQYNNAIVIDGSSDFLPTVFPNVVITNTPFTLTLLLRGVQGEGVPFEVKMENLGSYSATLGLDATGKYYVKVYNQPTAPTPAAPALPIVADDLCLFRDAGVCQNQLTPDKDIISLTFMGTGTKLNVYVNDITTPIITTNAVGNAGSPFQMTPSTGGGYVYGVHYYNRALSTTRVEKNGRMVASDLEKNFEVDSKRYNIRSKR